MNLCPGCQRPELHKMCPAYGTEYYMSGKPFTLELEAKIHELEATKQVDKYQSKTDSLS